MKKINKISSLVFMTLISSYILSCSQKTDINFTSLNPENIQISSNQELSRSRLDNPPFIANGSELAMVSLSDDGKIIKYSTFPNAKPVTIIYQSKWSIIESHLTTVNEANTSLKLISQNGYAKEYGIFQQRYDDAGLTRKK